MRDFCLLFQINIKFCATETTGADKIFFIFDKANKWRSGTSRIVSDYSRPMTLERFDATMDAAKKKFLTRMPWIIINMVKILFLVFLTSVSCAQTNSNWRQVMVDAIDDYEILSEDEIYLSDYDEPNDTVRASINVQNDEDVFSSIKLSSATFSNDTLNIILHATTPAYHHEYVISVSNGKYNIKYRFAGGGGVFDELLMPIATELRLNSEQFKKGQVIRGYTEFQRECIKPCKGGLFIAKGNFKATIE